MKEVYKLWARVAGALEVRIFVKPNSVLQWRI